MARRDVSSGGCRPATTEAGNASTLVGGRSDKSARQGRQCGAHRQCKLETFLTMARPPASADSAAAGERWQIDFAGMVTGDTVRPIIDREIVATPPKTR